MLLIGLQTIIQTVHYMNKKSENGYLSQKIHKNMSIKDANISATSVSEVTGIPRATCIRKLDKLANVDFR